MLIYCNIIFVVMYDLDNFLLILIFLAVSFAISISLKFLLKNKQEKIRKIPQLVIAITLLSLEVLKIIKFATGYNYRNLFAWSMNDKMVAKDYYALPFHFCSFFIYTVCIASFTKNKVKKFFEKLAFIWSALITLFTLVGPKVIMGQAAKNFFNGSFSNSHAIIFHLLCIVYFFIEIFVYNTKLEKGDFLSVSISLFVCALISISAAFIFNTNYCSVLYPDFGIDFIESIYQYNYVLYLLTVIVISYIIFAILYWLIYLLQNIRKKEQ